jgi:hypothetical protein
MRPQAPTNQTPDPPHIAAQPDSISSDFNRHRLTLISEEQEEGWQAEIRRYLRDLPANVSKNTDVVEWWQVSIPLIFTSDACSVLNISRITDICT